MWALKNTCYLEHAKHGEKCTYSFAFHFSCDCHIISLREAETSIVRCTEDHLLLRMICSSYCALETIRHVPPHVANHSCCGEWRMLHATDDVRVQTTNMGTTSWMNAETHKRLPSYTPLFGKQVKCTTLVASFPGRSHLRYFFTSSMQIWRGKAWEIWSRAVTQGSQWVDTQGEAFSCTVSSRTGSQSISNAASILFVFRAARTVWC